MRDTTVLFQTLQVIHSQWMLAKVTGSLAVYICICKRTVTHTKANRLEGHNCDPGHSESDPRKNPTELWEIGCNGSVLSGMYGICNY